MPKYSAESKISELVKDEEVLKLGKKYFPELFNSPYGEFFYDYRLSDLKEMARTYGVEKKYDDFLEELSKIE
ncbi:MAG: hypothetical protein PHI78_04890 [Clostridia bacterium]|nr:hypothetical protein [Clostridia bacterium]